MTYLNISPAAPTGWVCPTCRAVMAPHYPTCFYCKPQIPGTGIPFGPATTGTPPIWKAPYVSKTSGTATARDHGTRLQNEPTGRHTGMLPALGAPYGLGPQKQYTPEEMYSFIGAKNPHGEGSK